MDTRPHDPAPTGARPLVALVDDDAPVLDALRMYLDGAQFETHCFGSAAAFLEALRAGYKPGCLVTDVRMPAMSGLDLLAELKRMDAVFPVIIITGHGDVAMAVGAIKSGAWDFIEKPFDEEHLAGVIRSAIAQTSRRLADLEEVSAIRERMAELSDRQRDVMELAIKGYSNKEIAAQLGISYRTVETYRAWLMNRMGARNLADLVRMAMRVEASRR